jgi:hypothetical protein
MERLFLECTIRAALLVATIAIVLYVMRIKSAATSHSIWAVVVQLMLVLPIWTAWGPKASLARLSLAKSLSELESVRSHCICGLTCSLGEIKLESGRAGGGILKCALHTSPEFASDSNYRFKQRVRSDANRRGVGTSAARWAMRRAKPSTAAISPPSGSRPFPRRSSSSMNRP